MAFSIGSWNVLANSYVRTDYFPHTPQNVLNWSRRQSALVEAVVATGRDLICLQEVEPELHERLLSRLGPIGYAGHFFRKGRAKPDGCSTFFRRDLFTLENKVSRHFRDATGHGALLSQLQYLGKSLLVATTHLKWHPPDTPPEEHVGLSQITEVMRWRAEAPIDPASWIVCGDFNAQPDSPIVDALHDADLTDVFGDRGDSFTCNSNRRAKRIDYLFIGRNFTTTPNPMPVIDSDTPLPSASHPSDHLAVSATIGWRDSETFSWQS